jgi:hypothetical protein
LPVILVTGRSAIQLIGKRLDAPPGSGKWIVHGSGHNPHPLRTAHSQLDVLHPILLKSGNKILNGVHVRGTPPTGFALSLLS